MGIGWGHLLDEAHGGEDPPHPKTNREAANDGIGDPLGFEEAAGGKHIVGFGATWEALCKFIKEAEKLVFKEMVQIVRVP